MSSTRRRRLRRPLSISTFSSSHLVHGIEKPRAECSYNEIYPNLDVEAPLVVEFSNDVCLLNGENEIEQEYNLEGDNNLVLNSRNGRRAGSEDIRNGGTNGPHVNGEPAEDHIMSEPESEPGSLLPSQSEGQSPSRSLSQPHSHSKSPSQSQQPGLAIIKRKRRTNQEVWGLLPITNEKNQISKRTRHGHTSSNGTTRITRSLSTTIEDNEQSPLRRSSRLSIFPNYQEGVMLNLESEVSNTTANSNLNTSTATPSSFCILPKKNTSTKFDKSMISAGYKESDSFDIPDSYIRTFVRLDQSTVDENENTDHSSRITSTNTSINPVEYDMDEQDEHFLNLLNKRREDHIIKRRPLSPISREIFEITMTLLEIEWFKIEKIMPPKKKSIVEKDMTSTPDSSESDEKCAICDDSECDNSNAIVFCDGCDIAVHQDCYGVPFIPEGQWLCRQCTVSRRLRVNCIFCPNKSGALKQTDTQHWAHVLCSLWIPETSIANLSYMEPIIGLEKIPKGRWKLNCYICKQKVGACIQCVNKNCFQAFHPTCGRKAKLYMKMETGILGAIHDPTSMVVYCDRHSPTSYNESIDVRSHLRAAQRYYSDIRDKFSNSSLSLTTRRPPNQNTSASTTTPWRTEEGTPIIPEIIVNKIASLMTTRFNIVEFVDHFLVEVCRYWALKRQMKKGAALIKRLQIALEVQPKRGGNELSAEEIRDRINSKKQLLQKLELLRTEADNILERESLKLEKSEIQLESMDLMYFPETKLIHRIWSKLNREVELSDSSSTFCIIQQKVTTRQYSSIEEFSRDIENLINDLTPHISPPKWLQTMLREAIDISSAIDRDESGIPNPSRIEATGLNIQEEEWIGARLLREMSPMSDVDESYLNSLESEQSALRLHSKKRRKKRNV